MKKKVVEGTPFLAQEIKMKEAHPKHLELSQINQINKCNNPCSQVKRYAN